jgi:hypothetical protein
MSSASSAAATQFHCGARNSASARVSAGQPMTSSVPRMSTTIPATTGPRRHHGVDPVAAGAVCGTAIRIMLASRPPSRWGSSRLGGQPV